jgi:hypothetical protein
MTTYKDEDTGERLAIKGKSERVNVSARQNKSTATTTRITLNDVSATVIVPANPDRVFLSITMFPATSDVSLFVRYYPAAMDNIKHGVDVLTRRGIGGDSWFRPHHRMETNAIYTGEVSAIVNTGTLDVVVTEY